MKQVPCPKAGPSPFGCLFGLVPNPSQWWYSLLPPPATPRAVDEALTEAVFLPRYPSRTHYHLHSSVFILAGFSYVAQDMTAQSANNSLSSTMTTHGTTPTSGLNSKAAVIECWCPLTSMWSPLLFMTVPWANSPHWHQALQLRIDTACSTSKGVCLGHNTHILTITPRGAAASMASSGS